MRLSPLVQATGWSVTPAASSNWLEKADPTKLFRRRPIFRLASCTSGSSLHSSKNTVTSSIGPAHHGAKSRPAIRPKGICTVGMFGTLPTVVRKCDAKDLLLAGTDSKRRIKITGSSEGGS